MAGPEPKTPSAPSNSPAATASAEEAAWTATETEENLMRCLVAGRISHQWIDGWAEGYADRKHTRVNVRLHPSSNAIVCPARNVLLYYPSPFPEAQVGDEVLISTQDPRMWYEARVVDKNNHINCFEINFKGHKSRTNSYVTPDQFYTPIELSKRFSQAKNAAQHKEKHAVIRMEAKQEFLKMNRNEVQILTWKVGCTMDMKTEPNRLPSFLSTLRANNTDFLALQDVNIWLIDQLLSLEWFTERFPFSSVFLGGKKTLSNKSVFFSKHSIDHIELHQGYDGSVFSLIKIKFKGRNFQIANVNLPEGVSSANKRMDDSKLMCSVLCKIPAYSDDIVLAGSFEFAPRQHPECSIFSPLFFTDAWLAVKQDDGFTRDPTENKLCTAEMAQRLDYCFLRTGMWSPCAARLVGPGKKRSPPSPNFGVRITLRYNQEKKLTVEQTEHTIKSDSKVLFSTGDSHAAGDLSVLTYNVDSRNPVEDKSNLDDRIEGRNGLIDVFREQNADVVCLQEVRPWMLKELRDNYWFRVNYPFDTTEFDKEKAFLPWFMCVFSKFPILATSVYYRKPHMTTRCFLSVTLEINQRRLDVCNVFLNASLAGGCQRAMDIGFTCEEMRKSGSEDIIIAGGFNFKDGFSPEKTLIPSDEWEDAWLALHPDAKDLKAGATWDPDNNAMIENSPEAHIKAMKNIWGPSRLDRIVYRSEVWEPRIAKVVGRLPVNTDVLTRGKRCPSSHFGLFVKFAFTGQHGEDEHVDDPH
ncbi:hypothetical protein AAMO2058_000965000 [Amorphochlora amoebiformis]